MNDIGKIDGALANDRPSSQQVKLTETVQKGGCAAKLPAGELRNILGRLPKIVRPKELIVGAELMDDAALWDLGDGRLLIQTLDFFTPIVDDPQTFGAIAAANALSDVYAMGGRPTIALAILAFPTATLSLDILEQVMLGASQTIASAGAALAGGHSIDDDTLKFGLSVAGFVDKARAWTNAGVRPGQLLILTKPVGTGVVTTALKRRICQEEWLAAAIKSMMQLNDLSYVGEGLNGIKAATDITGFGLAGHALQVARASGVAIDFSVPNLPTLPGARQLLEQNVVNKAHRTNGAYVEAEVAYEAVAPADRLLTLDPQTSGGLLLAVEPTSAKDLLYRIREKFPLAAVVGQACAHSNGTPLVRFSGINESYLKM